MRRFRLVIATLVAVALMSFGAASCTPEQSSELGTGIGQVVGFVLYFTILQALCGNQTQHDCGP